MVEDFKKMNTSVVLLTGDNYKTANYLSNKIGITNVFAELLPQEKVSKIEDLKATNKKVCMIGDGINDAPAFKASNVGVAMGNIGSDIAIDASDIALMGDELSKIPYLKWLSDKTVSTIKISITLSMLINFAAVTLSVMQILTPTTGALVHNGGSVFVVLIAAMLYDKKYPGIV